MRSRIAAGLLAIVALLIMGVGAYFALFRPAFLPEDLRYIGADGANLGSAHGVTSWLRYVFVVLGGYAFTTGLFTAHIAFTALRSGNKMPVTLLGLAGLSSLGVMTAVNFSIHSDFRYLIAGLSALWVVSVLLLLPIWPRSNEAKAKALR